MSSVVGAVPVWPVESVAIAAISVCQPRVSLSISIGSRLGISRPLAIVVDGGDNGLASNRLDNGIASVAIAVVVEPAIGKGEWDNSLLLGVSSLHLSLSCFDDWEGVVGVVGAVGKTMG